MHITLESDYAVRIVHCLARKRERMDAKRIAEETGVTLRFSLKILRKLVTGGLVNSYKGTKGGYELARDPGEISLCDVIEMVEGPYSLARCLRETDYHCSRNVETCEVCKFQQVYAEISEAVREKLSAVKFSNT
ncbi:MAG: Rrf2 family transcriptional regulator [Angelakisella sp.]|jgi:Rrf2 family protein|nr:Rrf2 family transcriptional regulator [Angelakisella sp.]